MLKKCLIVLTVAALALPLTAKRSEALPAPPVAGSASIGAAVWVAGGIIGVATALCVYDLLLKINGQKNWDGTAKLKAK